MRSQATAWAWVQYSRCPRMDARGCCRVTVAPLRVMGRVSRGGAWRAVITVSPPASRQARTE